MAEYILTDITPKQGHLNGTYIYDITFVDLVDLQVYMCVVDESYRNFTRSHWDTIVTGSVPYGLYAGLRKTAKRDKDGLPVISADSHPQLISPMTEAEVFYVLEVRQQQLGLSCQD
jgi:hypothetical protein